MSPASSPRCTRGTRRPSPGSCEDVRAPAAAPDARRDERGAGSTEEGTEEGGEEVEDERADESDRAFEESKKEEGDRIKLVWKNEEEEQVAFEVFLAMSLIQDFDKLTELRKSQSPGEAIYQYWNNKGIGEDRVVAQPKSDGLAYHDWAFRKKEE